jgi:hypothetical protein
LQAKEVKEKLKALISEASLIDASLAKRLDKISRWIKDTKDGSLNTKKLVMAFLLEVIEDSEVWLQLKIQSSEDQQSNLDKITAPARYWYSYLFPKWLNEQDAKLYIWKQKMMAGQFTQEDARLLAEVVGEIKSRQGNVLQRYVADLSMATDLIVSSSQGEPLCIQLTTLDEEFSDTKYEDWKKTLHQWGIERGLFFSFNPSKPEFIKQLVNIALYNSNNLKIGSYLKFSIPL